jgi:putative hydrolase of the HAD superfamily
MTVVFDLDDTLYDEIDFVRSGFLEVASYLGDRKYYEFMWQKFHEEGSGKIFDILVDSFDLREPVQKLIEIYRFHTPAISLPRESDEILKYCKNFSTALITDGHYIMQKNKFHALELQGMIDYPVFTDLVHTRKPEPKAYQMIMRHFSGNAPFVYISDNPQKDFVAPRKLGWISIRFKNPRGIYRQLKSDADYEVASRKEILELLRKLNA